MDERQVVAAQIGRPLRSEADVVVACHLGLPVVTRVPPRLADGTPFPTRYWLSCPLAVLRIDRLEGGGGVGEMDRRVASDPEFASRFAASNHRYQAERDAHLAADALPKPSGGVGGTSGGVKCLHAHYADHVAGNDNPVGELVAPSVEPLDCAIGCVVEVAGAVIRNPQWREPS